MIIRIPQGPIRFVASVLAADFAMAHFSTVAGRSVELNATIFALDSAIEGSLRPVEREYDLRNVAVCQS